MTTQPPSLASFAFPLLNAPSSALLEQRQSTGLIPTRLGVINYWLFQHEVFHFAQGRLFLTGHNGSGKSTALTAAITLLLDGDSSPARLDAFGSRQRTLAYYLLGNEQAGFNQDARRSYLTLEFVDPGGRYQTIGLGLQLQRGGDLKKWGFWLPGQVEAEGALRLTEDGQPLSELKLRERVKHLGGEVVTGQVAHETMVRRRIYGPDVSPDAYRATIDLLLTLRGSKLGGEVRLAQVERLMRDALRPVSTQDRSALNAGIDKIDTHLEAIALLERQQAATAAIAQALFQATAARIRTATQQQHTAEQALNSARTQLSSLQSNLSTTEAELQASEQTRAAAQQALSQTNSELDSLNMAMGESQGAQRRLEHAMDESRKRTDMLGTQLQRVQKEQARTRTRVEKDQAALGAGRLKLGTLQERLRARTWWTGQDSLAQRRQQLRSATEAFAQFQRGTTLLSTHRQRLADAHQRQRQSRAAHEQAREALEAELLRSAGLLANLAASLQVQEQRLPDDLLDRYRASLSVTLPAAESFSVLEDTATDLETLARTHEDQARDRHASLSRQVHDLRQHLAELNAQIEAEPPLPPDRPAALQVLREHGVTATPLYALVRPRTGADPAELAGTEAALGAAGLLTALYVHPAQRDAALDLLKHLELSDHLLNVPVPGIQPVREPASLLHLLEPEERTDVSGTEVTNLLEQLSRLHPGGAWHNGALSGQATPRPGGGALYLGREAREQERQGRQTKAEQALARLETDAGQADEDLKTTRSEHALLRQGLTRLRAPTDLQAGRTHASDLRDQARTRYEAAVDQEKRDQSTLDDTQRQTEEERRRLEQAFAPLGVVPEPDRTVLKQLQDDFDQADRDVTESGTLLERTGDLERTLLEAQDSLAQFQDTVTETERERGEHQERVKALSAELRALHARQDTPDMAAQHARLADLQRQSRKSAGIISEETRRVERLRERATNFRTQLPGAQEATEQQRQQHQEAQNETRRLIGGHPRFRDLPAEQLDELLETGPHTGSVMHFTEEERNIFEQHRSALETPFSYSPLYRNGPSFLIGGDQRVGPDELLEHLEQRRQEFLALLTEEEGEVFSGMLIRNLVEELHRKVQEADTWTEQIRKSLRRLDFHGESFDLRRTPRPQGGQPGEGLARLIDGKVAPNVRPDTWWAEVTQELRQMITTLRASSGNDLPFAQAFEQALDHRQWADFHFYSRTGSGAGTKEREITDRNFMTRSGGERSAVLYTYLFAATGARFDTLGPGVPRLIGIDEAFAGMDLDNISSLYRVMNDLDLSWIATSERPVHLSPALPLASAYQLFRESSPSGDSVSRLAFLWNGGSQQKGSEAGL